MGRRRGLGRYGTDHGSEELVRIWVTGGTGQIGRRLCVLLAKQGHHVTVLGRRPDTFLPPRHWVTWDMSTDELPVDGLEDPDVIFHLAAQTSAYRARASLSLDVSTNVVGLARVLDAARLKGCSPHVVMAGAATEVGVTNDETVNDSLPDNPGTLYDVGKICQRLYLEQCRKEGWIDSTVLRFSNVYGGTGSPLSAHRGFINRSVVRALQGHTLNYFDDGDYVRDFVFVDDAVEALVKAMDHRAVVTGKTYMVGSGRGIPISRALECIADEVFEITGAAVSVLPVAAPDTLYEIERRDAVVSSRRFQEDTGWKPQTPFEEGIRISITALLEQEARD